MLNIKDPQAADNTATPLKPATLVNVDGRDDIASKFSTKQESDYINGDDHGSVVDFESVLSAISTTPASDKEVADTSHIENHPSENQINLSLDFSPKLVQAPASDQSKEGLLSRPHNAASFYDTIETKHQTQITDENVSEPVHIITQKEAKNTDVQLQNLTANNNQSDVNLNSRNEKISPQNQTQITDENVSEPVHIISQKEAKNTDVQLQNLTANNNQSDVNLNSRNE